MTKGQLKNFLDGMFNEETKGLQEGDQVTQEVIDNMEVAFEAIMERACDPNDDGEDDEDEDILDAEGNDLEAPEPKHATTENPDIDNDGQVTQQEVEAINHAEELKSQGPKGSDTEVKR